MNRLMFNRLARKKLEALRKAIKLRGEEPTKSLQFEIKWHKTEKKHYDGKETNIHK